jgi:hypothetical protein
VFFDGLMFIDAENTCIEWFLDGVGLDMALRDELLPPSNTTVIVNARSCI